MTEEETEHTFREEWEAYKKERNDRLRRFFIKVVAMFAFLGFTVSATIYYVYTSQQENTQALCAVRADAERRVILGEQFLEDHPDGIAGFSAEQIQVSIDNSRETAESLSVVTCPPIEVPSP